MIKNLIFDFGKVLVDYDFEAFFRKYIPDTERCQAFIPLLIESHDTSTEAMKKLRNEYHIRIKKEQQK